MGAAGESAVRGKCVAVVADQIRLGAILVRSCRTDVACIGTCVVAQQILIVGTVSADNSFVVAAADISSAILTNGMAVAAVKG